MKIGRVSENVLKRSVLQQIRTKRKEVIGGVGIGKDCVIYAPQGVDDRNGVTVISCTGEGFLDRGIAPLLQRCVNVLAARGAEPAVVSLRLLFPADAEEKRLRTLMAEAENFCHTVGMQMAEAGCRVSENVTLPYGTVSIMGAVYGLLPRNADRDHHMESDYHTVKAARPGQDIIISKWIGLEGTAILAKRHGESLLQRYPAWLVEEAEGFERYLSTVPEAAAAIKAGAAAIHNASEGGVFAALWELAEGANAGLTVDLKKLPLKQETVEICNHCNVNPYELLSGGSLLMTAKDGPGVVSALETAGIPAVIVGKVTDSRDRLILNEEEVRYLDRPHMDEIYK